MHFENTLDFLDLFLPINVSSASRARAFLWLCYHYLESPDSSSDIRNPFADLHVPHPHKIPPLVTLTAEEMEHENVDSKEELEWAERMSLQRKELQVKMEKGEEKVGGDGGSEDIQVQENVHVKGKATGTGGGKDPAAAKAAAKERKAAADKARRERQKELKKAREAAALALGEMEAGNSGKCRYHYILYAFLKPRERQRFQTQNCKGMNRTLRMTGLDYANRHRGPHTSPDDCAPRHHLHPSVIIRTKPTPQHSPHQRSRTPRLLVYPRTSTNITVL